MLLLHDLDLAILQGELEHGDAVVAHELRGYGATDQVGELCLAVGDVLVGLDDAVLIRAAFCLDGDDELAAVAVDADVDLIDFELADALEVGSQVVLQRIRSDAEEDVDQPVVAHLGE
ncbi:hypothetical protein D3C78_980800 [compost metagenome]